jgi:hypothetical protein
MNLLRACLRIAWGHFILRLSAGLLLAGRDPQLAILCTLIVLALAFMGGGELSLDAWLNNRRGPAIEKSI